MCIFTTCNFASVMLVDDIMDDEISRGGKKIL